MLLEVESLAKNKLGSLLLQLRLVGLSSLSSLSVLYFCMWARSHKKLWIDFSHKFGKGYILVQRTVVGHILCRRGHRTLTQSVSINI